MKDPLDNQTLDLVEVAKRPLTGAQRQERRRQKLRHLKKTQGLKSLLLSGSERALLRTALDLLNEYQSPKGEAAEAQLALLQKLAPGAEWLPENRRIISHIRSNADCMVTHAQGEQRRAQAAANKMEARALAAEHALKSLGAEQVDGNWQGVEQLPEDMAAMLVAQGPVVACLHAVNSVREIARVASNDSARALESRREVERLARDNLLLEEERNKAFAAYRVLEDRLRAAGLSTDYRG